VRPLATGPVALLALAAAGALLVAGPWRARGAGAGSGPGGPDLSSPEVVCAQALSALETGDLASLLPLLDEGASAGLLRDLGAWRDALASPSDGPRTLARLAPARGEADRDELRRALEGDARSLLRAYVRSDPHPAPSPPPPPTLSADRSRAAVDVAAPDGRLRRLLLSRGASGWRIERFPL
jgi:hypothetical protein